MALSWNGWLDFIWVIFEKIPYTWILKNFRNFKTWPYGIGLPWGLCDFRKILIRSLADMIFEKIPAGPARWPSVHKHQIKAPGRHRISGFRTNLVYGHRHGEFLRKLFRPDWRYFDLQVRRSSGWWSMLQTIGQVLEIKSGASSGFWLSSRNANWFLTLGIPTYPPAHTAQYGRP